jgi:hypothetical protein
MKPEGLVWCSQELNTNLYHYPHESSKNSIIFRSNINIIPQSMLTISKWSFSFMLSYKTQYASPLYVTYVSISFSLI